MRVKHYIVKSTDGTKLAVVLCPAVLEAFKRFEERGSAGFDISVPAEAIPGVKECVAEMIGEIQGDTTLTVEFTETAASSSNHNDTTTKLSVRFRQQTNTDITAAAAATTT